MEHFIKKKQGTKKEEGLMRYDRHAGGRLLLLVSLSQPPRDTAQTPERDKHRALLNPSYVNTAFPSRSGCRRRTGYNNVYLGQVGDVLALRLIIPPTRREHEYGRSQYSFSLCIDGELIFSKHAKRAFVCERWRTKV